MEAEREEVLERALPFREGEEVYVNIVEPHMYNPGDAVAKVDGYIIHVKGAEASVGHKRLVRIEEVGRTAAVAQVVDEEPLEDLPITDEGDAPEVTPEDEVESAGRRRGRRGGRRAQLKVEAATTSESSPE
jgi:ribonuclease G